MIFVNLPDEILIIILSHLDVESLYNLHTASDRIRNIIRKYQVIKTCSLSLTIISNAETLKSPFFQDISRNLKELNVCGMYDLSKTSLLSAIKKLHCLNTLDVTYTNITMTDFIQLYSVCPTITDISINFCFDKSLRGFLHEESLQLYQIVFKNILNVHFVGNPNVMLLNPLPSKILKKSNLKKLKYTVNPDVKCDVNYIIFSPRVNLLAFDNFSISYSHSTVLSSVVELTFAAIPEIYISSILPFDVLDYHHYEIFIIILRRKYGQTKPVVCYATPIFEKFFSKYSHLQGDVEYHFVNNFEIGLGSYVHFMLWVWKKSATKFDHSFFSNLWCMLKPFFPCYFESMTSSPVAPHYDLYITIPYETENVPETGPMVVFKRQRIVAPNCVLNYDCALKEKRKLQLAFIFDSHIKGAVSLSSNCDYLKKITFLSLSGQVRYSADFFNVLFRCCNNLVTLRVKAAFVACSAAIARSLPISRSIKNIHLTDKNIDFPTLYSSMSQCKMLEIVHILDTSQSTNFTDASLVLQKCVNLHCLYLYINSSQSDTKKFIRTLKRTNGHTNVKIISNKHFFNDPYSNVFRLDLLQ